ncbi:GIY-YIG catalytic domain-containing endonuclease [Paramecium bursaria Chlorella virus Can18-4]|nr:GIY-YIG catalytic domain-containing endonuclease [Paramecium bursaria Chlorella virus Can18-4]
MGFIYKLTYKKSRKAYIGQTIRPIEERLKEHQLESSKCKAISGAVKKHGWDNFDVEWYEIPDDELNFYEEMLVALLGTIAPYGYNLQEGGGNGKHSEESKQKMSEAMTGEKNHMYGRTGEKSPNYGKTLDEETKKKISEAMTGKTHTNETKQKMSKARIGEKHHFYGKTLSDENKQKLSEANTGEKNPMSKKVYQYTLDGAYVGDFASSGEAARALGRKDGTSISSCARGDCKTAYGFKWSREKL